MHTILLAQLMHHCFRSGNTRAVPLVRKEDAHQGRVSFCPDTELTLQGDFEK